MPRQQTSHTDNVHYHETPEGILLQLKLAGPVVRACAWSIDSAVRMVLYAVIGFVNSLLGGVGVALILIGFFLIE